MGTGIPMVAGIGGMTVTGLGLPIPGLPGSDLAMRAANITWATGTETMDGLSTTITGTADAKEVNVTTIAGTTTTTITKTSKRLRPVIMDNRAWPFFIFLPPGIPAIRSLFNR